MNSKATILVVDDDPGVRDSLRALLESAGFLVEDYGSAAGFLEARSQHAGDCLIVDIRMPDMDGLTLQEELIKRHDALPVIVVTGHGDVPLAVRAMKAGAVDFIEKPFDDHALMASIGRALERRAQTGALAASAQAIAQRAAALTVREREVLVLLVTGDPNKVIAHKLSISPRTVEIHRARVMQKMGARSLSELVRMALAAGVAESGI